jgi:predicted nucleic acid-binding protein
VIYVDTSALLKEVLTEPESAALRDYLEHHASESLVSSILLTVEMRRAVHRTNPRLLPRTDLLLARVTQVDLSAPVVETASRFPDAALRSLDAIHVATALLVREELTAVVSYDKRMVAAAHSEGLPVVSPGGGT